MTTVAGLSEQLDHFGVILRQTAATFCIHDAEAYAALRFITFAGLLEQLGRFGVILRQAATALRIKNTEN